MKDCPCKCDECGHDPCHDEWYEKWVELDKIKDEQINKLSASLQHERYEAQKLLPQPINWISDEA